MPGIGSQLAVEAHQRRRGDLEVEVGAAGRDEVAQGGRRRSKAMLGGRPSAACRVLEVLRLSGVSLRHVAQLLRLGEALQLLERLVLDLADALARDVERAPDLVERARVLAAEAVAQLEDAALAVGEVLQRLAQRLLGEDLGGALVRRLGALVGDELAELRLLLVADRLLERDRRLRRALDRVDLFGIDAR